MELLKPRIATIHLSDNDGRIDQHLWPGSVEKNGIDFQAILPSLSTLPPKTPWILEIAHDTNEDLDAVARHFTQTLDATSTVLRRPQTADPIQTGDKTAGQGRDREIVRLIVA